MTKMITHFPADRATYFRAHLRMAAVFMAGAMGLLWVMGNSEYWVGGIGALAAISVRGWYLRDEELAVDWRVEDDALLGPADTAILLSDITAARAMGSFVQIVTERGDKYLIKYQADPAATIAAIERAKP